MSRRSTKEYILRKRDDYLGETQRGKHRMLDEICKTVGLTRKYVIKLMTGNIRYRERKGGGKSYSDSVRRQPSTPSLPHTASIHTSPFGS